MYNIVGSTGMGGPKSETQRALRGGILGRGCSLLTS